MDFLNFASYDMETWSVFFKENWLVLAIALLVLFLIIRIVKTVVKWALVAVIVIGLVLYSGYTLDDVKELGGKVVDSVKQEAVNVMLGEAENAEYKAGSDGTFTITTSNVELTGKVGSNEVKVSLRGTPAITLQVDSTIQSFIDEARQKG